MQYMFNFIDSFIPVSGCVGMGHSAHSARDAMINVKFTT
jgi:hypothetical protein